MTAESGQRWAIVAPLEQFTTADEFELAPGVQVSAITDAILPLLERAAERRLFQPVSEVRYCLVIWTSSTDEVTIREQAKLAEEVLLRFRLLRPGPIGFHFLAFVPEDELRKGIGEPGNAWLMSLRHYMVWARPGITPLHYELSASEAESLRELWKRTSGERLLRRLAFRQFFRGCHEPYATDRFLANAIGLENLLLGDSEERSSLAYKFQLRGAFLLKLAATLDPRESFDRLRAIYAGRSRLVHSSRSPVEDWEEEEELALLADSEKYLRILLNQVLNRPEMGGSQAIDSAILDVLA